MEKDFTKAFQRESVEHLAEQGVWPEVDGCLKGRDHKECWDKGRVWWYTHLNPSTQETEVGGSL